MTALMSPIGAAHRAAALREAGASGVFTFEGPHESDPGHASARRLLAFYGSTPAYRPALDVHGWGDLQPELNALSKQGRWAEMGGLIDDNVLHTIAACGTPADIAAHIRDRAAGVADRVCLYQPGPIPAETLSEIVDALTAGART